MFCSEGAGVPARREHGRGLQEEEGDPRVDRRSGGRGKGRASRLLEFGLGTEGPHSSVVSKSNTFGPIWNDNPMTALRDLWQCLMHRLMFFAKDKDSKGVLQIQCEASGLGPGLG